MNRSNGTWVKNMCQKLENMCTDIDEFVCKEPGLFVGNQMVTVGDSVKNFFSGFVDDFVHTQLVDRVQHLPQLIPSKRIDLAETSTNSIVEIKENTVDSNTNDPKESPLAPKESCQKQSSTSLHHSEQITSEISQHFIGERDSLIFKTSDYTSQIDLDSSTNIQNLDNRSEEGGVVFDESVHSDSTAFEYSDWGIENILDLDLDIHNTYNGESLMNMEEKETLLDGPTNELECDSNTSTTHQSPEVESSVTFNENQEENATHIITDGLSSENLHESLSSSFRNSSVEPVTIECNPTETVDCVSESSDNLSSYGSFTTLAYDSNNEESCSGTGLADGSTVDPQDVKKDIVETGVIVEGGKPFGFSNTSRSKSYKKMIQDAFMSRKRLTKEYKQLAIWYGDIDKELCQPTQEISKVPAQDLPDSEWELL
ncbi:hypothetical protein SSX86_005800 [Deinandra increscens subsp. villosa]|uniref:Uncharacterized protein n=1 Tax=Deinandra increscens subsp. villosa TaxID=3103831 RepID=A0AAP0DQQ0_9ASTR